MTYDGYKNKSQKDYNKFSKGKIFYAFDMEQFKEGMESIGLNPKETNKIARLCGGAYILNNEIKNYIKFNNKQRNEFNKKMKNFDFAKSAFKSELANHEYGYTMDPYDAITALGYTDDEVNNNPLLCKALQAAKEEYLDEY